MAAEHRATVIEAVEVIPVAGLGTGLLREVVRHLSRSVGVPCLVGLPLDLDGLPQVPGREQADADRLLEALEDRAPGNGTAVLGLTQVDLGHRLFTFFFGRARIGGAALVSVARLDPGYYGMPADRETMLRRAVRECLHELGHVSGLRHCEDYGCVMSFSGDVEALDVRGHSFCDPCAADLGHSLGLGGASRHVDWPD